MAPGGTTNSSQATARLKAAQAALGKSQHELLEAIAVCSRFETWRTDGYRDFNQWVAAQIQTSSWNARGWANAAIVLPALPGVAEALIEGSLSIDKVLKLSRYATPETEGRLIAWAKRVAPVTIRRAADVANAPDREETIESDTSRHLDYLVDRRRESPVARGILALRSGGRDSEVARPNGGPAAGHSG